MAKDDWVLAIAPAVTAEQLAEGLARAELSGRGKRVCKWPKDWSDNERADYRDRAKYLKRKFCIVHHEL